MRTVLRKYLGKNVALDVRMFYIASFCSAASCLMFLAIGLLLRVNGLIVNICAALFAMCVLLFLLETRFHRTSLYTMILLILCNIVGMPAVMILSDSNSVEIPIYFLVGLTYSLVLLNGMSRFIIFTLQFVIDICTIIYCFGIRTKIADYPFATSFTDLIRIEFAMLVSGILCGVVLYYRNRTIINEITDRKNSTIKAEKANLSKDMFLVNVSHEIRTPLNAIIGTTDVVLESEASSHIKEMAFHISNSSHALLSITSDLLDFSRINFDSMQVNNEKYDISFMLNDIINLMSVRLLDSNVDFYVDISPKLPKNLIGDCGKIRQIIINLLSNAIKYTKEGYILFSVAYEECDDGNVGLNISVKDTGIGVRKENIMKIFEPLHRSGSDDVDYSFEGNGLGLAYCKKLSTVMGGKLDVESEFGVGSTFSFAVKQAVDEELIDVLCGSISKSDENILFWANNIEEIHNLGVTFEKMNISAKEVFSEDEFIENINETFTYYFIESSAYDIFKDRINEVIDDWSKVVVISQCNYTYSGEPFDYVLTRPLSCLNISDLLNHTTGFMVRRQTYEGNFTIPDATILIVDDNLVNLDVASTLLNRYNPKILKAASGKEALIILKKEHVDLVFLDYMMPDMDGIDTLKQIRKLDGDEFKSLPVISLTANVVSGAREHFMSEGFDDYLSKPVERDKLEKMLTHFLPKDMIKFVVH